MADNIIDVGKHFYKAWQKTGKRRIGLQWDLFKLFDSAGFTVMDGVRTRWLRVMANKGWIMTKQESYKNSPRCEIHYFADGLKKDFETKTIKDMAQEVREEEESAKESDG